MSKVNGWFCWEEPSGAYEIGTDNKVRKTGKRSGYVKQVSSAGQFGAMMQKISAVEYFGKRVRFSGFLKCKEVVGNCGFFMEVFDRDGLLAVDNMANRNLTGNADWTKCELVLDVSEKALGINIGARLFGQGQLWIDGVQFEVVGSNVPVTDELQNRYSEAPQNLSFED